MAGRQGVALDGTSFGREAGGSASGSVDKPTATPWPTFTVVPTSVPEPTRRIWPTFTPVPTKEPEVEVRVGLGGGDDLLLEAGEGNVDDTEGVGGFPGPTPYGQLYRGGVRLIRQSLFPMQNAELPGLSEEQAV